MEHLGAILYSNMFEQNSARWRVNVAVFAGHVNRQLLADMCNIKSL